ncbi:MAG: phosphate regulon sensor histidine kinase PhoR [Parahaliea sp.]
MSQGGWQLELRCFAVVVAGGLVLGWLLGFPLAGLALVLVIQTLFWLFQLCRIHRWLLKPQERVPESTGIWGEVYDQIYHLQRRNRESHARLQSTVDYLQDSFAAVREGIVMVNEEGAIEWHNQAAAVLLGLQYPRDQGQALLNLVRIPEFNHYFLSGDFSEPLQLRLNGDVLQVLQFEITPFGMGDRLIFVRDVTEFERLEQMRRDFVGNVSHELRTPLTVLKGYLDTMQANSDEVGARFLRPLQQMEQQTVRMENLLKDLLWLSRIEGMRRQDEHIDIDMPALINELRDELATSHPQRQLQLDVDQTCICRIRGDRQELHSAVSNLILNAYKYSADDTLVFVGWKRRGETCVLSVRDSGVGIAAAHIPRITERFYRVDDSRSSATGGTGLGLAIVKHVVAAHSARLHIESETGKGSTFSIEFMAL